MVEISSPPLQDYQRFDYATYLGKFIVPRHPIISSTTSCACLTCVDSSVKCNVNSLVFPKFKPWRTIFVFVYVIYIFCLPIYVRHILYLMQLRCQVISMTRLKLCQYVILEQKKIIVKRFIRPAFCCGMFRLSFRWILISMPVDETQPVQFILSSLIIYSTKFQVFDWSITSA